MARSVFAMEVCARLDLAPELHQTLAARMQWRPEHMGLDEKWAFYRDVACAITASLGNVERGCWDFFDDDAKAKKLWDDWSKALIEREGARAEPLHGVDPYRGGEPRYLTFTIVMLLVRGSPSERMFGITCDIPETQLWTRATFARILDGLRALSFASVEADVAYLLPRDSPYAFTRGDLESDKFSYLRMLV